MLLNDHWLTEEIKENFLKIPGDIEKLKHNYPNFMGYCKSSSKRNIYSNTILPLEIRKISNKQSKLTPKGTRQRRTNITQS